MALDGKTALLTCADRGISEARAIELAKAGAGVAVTDLDRDAADETSAKIGSLGRRSLAIRADIGDLSESKPWSALSRVSWAASIDDIKTPAKTANVATHFILKTLYTELGRCIPLKVRSPIGSTSTMSLAALYTRWLIKI